MLTTSALVRYTHQTNACHLQGPVAAVRITEVSLGHTRNATKTAQAALSWQFKVPFTIRDLVIELRQPVTHSNAKTGPTSPAKEHRHSTALKSGHKVLLNTGLRLLLGVLPNIPIRIKQLTIKQVSGILR